MVWMLHHCGHTFLCSLRWPHGWMLHNGVASTHEVIWLQRKVCPQWCSIHPWGHLRLQRKVVHNGVASTHEVISDYRERCVHNGVAYTIVDTPFSVVWETSRCVHNGVASTHEVICSLIWPHGWMLHHCVASTFLCRSEIRPQRKVDATPLWSIHLSL